MPRLSFTNVAGPWRPHDPPRSLRPEQGVSWRYSNNLRGQDGYLVHRRGVRPLPGSVTQPPVDYAPLVTRIELPLWIFQVNTGNFTSGSNFQSEVGTILVTTTDIYAHDDAGWSVLTPAYTTGTISASAGNPAITGVGTLWLTNSLAVGNLILVGAQWLRITNITGEGAMTVSPAPSAGHAGAYTIRRTFNDVAPYSGGSEYFSPRRAIYAVMHNGDVYVGGSSLVNKFGPGILRVQDPFATAPTVEYLVVGLNVTGVDVQNISEIHGIDVLQDGRVIAAVTDIGSGGGDSRYSRLIYSSHLDQTVWNASPGGFVDVTCGGKGKITAIGRLGGNTTVHYEDAVAIGYPTGQDDPPLELRSTQATHGCVAPRTLRVASGGEMYLDSRGSIRVFDGSTDQVATNDFRDFVGPFEFNKTNYFPFAHVDPFRNEYQVFMPDAPGDELIDMVCLVVSTIGEGTRREYYPYTFTAISAEYLAAPGLTDPIPSGDQTEASAIIGLSAASVTFTSPLAILREGIEDDPAVQTNNGTNTFPTRAETDPLDFNSTDRLKRVDRVIVRMRKPLNSLSAVGSEVIRVSLSPDGGATYPAGMQATKTFTYSGVGDDDTQVFYFEQRSALTWKMRIEPTTVQRLVGAIEWIDIDATLGAFEQAV